MPKSLDAFISKANGENDAQMAGFMLKIAAIILSSYQEVSLSAIMLNYSALACISPGGPQLTLSCAPLTLHMP